MSQLEKHIDTLLFDFDGTLADTLDLGIKISNSLALRFGYNRISGIDDLQKYRSLKTQDALKAIGISRLKLPLIANTFRKRLAADITDLKPIEGIPEIVKRLAANYKLGIITSNSDHNIHQFLRNHKMEGFFTFYSTGISLFKKHVTINTIIKKNKLSRNQVILIGDETRDIEAARKCLIPIIAVTWGFHNSDLLEKMTPDYVASLPKDLLEILI